MDPNNNNNNGGLAWLKAQCSGGGLGMGWRSLTKIRRIGLGMGWRRRAGDREKQSSLARPTLWVLGGKGKRGYPPNMYDTDVYLLSFPPVSVNYILKKY